jgi:hypothetical protein
LFSIDENYKTQFEHQVDSLIKEKIEDRDIRMARVSVLINTYVDEIGERPEAFQIERLTNEILREELTDKNPHKMKHEESPIASHSQLSRRRRKESSFDLVEDKVAGDRKRKGMPHRRMRSNFEQVNMDLGREG